MKRGRILWDYLIDLYLFYWRDEKMDGFETCKTLKQNADLQSVPVIFMTGLDSEYTVESSFNSGAADYIQKPIRIKELVARIKTHIKKSRQITMSRELLDSVGLSSIAVDNNGNIKWMTPKAGQLLDMGYDKIKAILRSKLLM